MKNLLLCMLVAFAGTAFGQYSTTNAIGGGMGQAIVALDGHVALLGNPAGLVSLEKWGATAAAERRFSLSELQSVALGAALPTKGGAFGFQLQAFGYEGFRQQKIGIAYARKLWSSLSLGAQFDYFQTRIPEYGGRGVITFELGMQAAISRRVAIGAHLFSPAQVELAEGENLPTVLRLGLCWSTSERLKLCSELEKDLDQKMRWRTGVAYSPLPALTFRTGFATEPSMLFFGAGFAFGNGLRADAAGIFHEALGFTPAVSVTRY